MRPTGLGTLIGIRVKNNHIVGAIFSTNLFRYPFCYVSKKGDTLIIETLNNSLTELVVKGRGVVIFRKPKEITIEEGNKLKVFKEVSYLPAVLEGRLRQWRSYKTEEEEDYLIFSPFADDLMPLINESLQLATQNIMQLLV